MTLGESGIRGTQIASVALRGVLWDVHLEMEDDPHRPDTCRARLRFAAGSSESGGAGPKTAFIIIEDSQDAVLSTACGLDEGTLVAMLRSALDGER